MNKHLTKKIIYEFAQSAVMLYPAIDWYKLSMIIKKYYPLEQDIENKVYEALKTFQITDKKNKDYTFKIFKVKTTESYFNGYDKPLNLIATDINLKNRKIAIQLAYRINIAKDIYTGYDLDQYLDSGLNRIDRQYIDRIKDFLISINKQETIDYILEQLLIFSWRIDFELNQFVGYFISQFNLEGSDQKVFYQLIWDYYENTRVPYLYGYTRSEALDRKIKQDKNIIDLIEKAIN